MGNSASQEPAIVDGDCPAVTEAAPSGMVERVARAMATADGCDPDEPAYMRYPGPTTFGICWRDKYAAKARAAIEAMRQPTEGMVEAAWTDTVRATPDERMALELGDAKEAFRLKLGRRHRAMIDAALRGAK